MNVVITGGSKGIGKAIATRFATAGYSIYLCSRDTGRLQATTEELQSLFPAVKIKGKVADLSVKEQVLQFGDWCLEQTRPDILINNAGIYLPGSTISEAEGSLEKMMQINFYSAYHLTRKLLPAMIEKGGGHIFNTCSIASLHAYEGGGGYSISKYALLGFTKNLRHELKSHHIKVTAIIPGAVLTDSWANFDNSEGRIMEAD